MRNRIDSTLGPLRVYEDISDIDDGVNLHVEEFDEVFGYSSDVQEAAFNILNEEIFSLIEVFKDDFTDNEMKDIFVRLDGDLDSYKKFVRVFNYLGKDASLYMIRVKINFNSLFSYFVELAESLDKFILNKEIIEIIKESDEARLASLVAAYKN